MGGVTKCDFVVTGLGIDRHNLHAICVWGGRRARPAEPLPSDFSVARQTHAREVEPLHSARFALARDHLAEGNAVAHAEGFLVVVLVRCRVWSTREGQRAGLHGPYQNVIPRTRERVVVCTLAERLVATRAGQSDRTSYSTWKPLIDANLSSTNF